MTLLTTINNAIDPLRRFSDTIASPLLDLGIRLFAANIFFTSGWSKFKNFLNDDWGTTLYLFQDVHIVPLIPAQAAAVLGTGTEVLLPILLVFGLFTRFAAAGLIATTVLIEFFVVDGFGDSLSNPDHYLWMLILAVPFIKGPGKLSLDHFLVKILR